MAARAPNLSSLIKRVDVLEKLFSRSAAALRAINGPNGVARGNKINKLPREIIRLRASGRTAGQLAVSKSESCGQHLISI